MGKERIERYKENNRYWIMDAVLQLDETSGWNAVIIRKIANFIAYTAPIIYECFGSKEGLLRVPKCYYIFLSITHSLIAINLISDDVPKNIRIRYSKKLLRGSATH